MGSNPTVKKSIVRRSEIEHLLAPIGTIRPRYALSITHLYKKYRLLPPIVQEPSQLFMPLASLDEILPYVVLCIITRSILHIVIMVPVMIAAHVDGVYA